MSFDKEVYSKNLNKTCDIVEMFINENKYPIIKRLENEYLTRIQKDKKILLVAAIYKSKTSHVNFLNNFFHNIAIKNRNYVFTYLDAKQDAHLLQFFNIKNEDIPKIIIYDFAQGKHFIDKYSYLEDANAMENLNDLIQKIQLDEIEWTTGYAFEDFLHKIGINISRNNLMIVLIGFVTFGLICFIICTCSIMDSFKEESIQVKKNI